MHKFITELLAENGQISTMRVMSLIALFIGSFLALYGIYENKDLSGVAQLVAVFVGAAFTAKVTQKLVETKSKKDDTDQ